MATIRAIASGNFSSGSTWNGNTVPSTGDEAVASGFSVTITDDRTVVSLRNDTLGGATAGGNFTLSAPNITVSVTSLVAGVTNLIIANATSGTNTLNVTNGIGGINSTNSAIINHSGAGNLTIITPFVVGGGPLLNLSNSVGITKSGLGTLTVGTSTNPTNIRGGGGLNAGNGSSNNGIRSSNGDIVIVGNVQGPSISGISPHSIVQFAGNLTITGNVVGGTSNGNAINSSSTGFLDITGNVTGGSGAATISKSSGAITVTGNISGSNLQGIIGSPTSITVIGDVTGATSQGINVTNAAAITITGKVTAGPSATAAATNGGAVTVTGNVTATANGNGISTTGLVSVDGLLENTGNVQAVYSPRILIGTATTSIRYQTSLGATQLMYLGTSGVSGQPTTNNVRFGTPFGVDNTFVGTCRIPTPDTVLLGTPTDDTTGTLLMTPDQFVTELNNSSTAVAVRLRNVSTVETTGDQIVSYNV